MIALRLPHNSRPSPRTGFLHLLITLTTLGWAMRLGAQTTPVYAGRPFVQIARANANDPVAGFISGFGRAQSVGNSVVFVPMSGVSAGGVFRGRGGPLAKVAAPGTSVPDGNLLFFHDGFARDTTTGAQVVIATGTARADALYQTDGTDFTQLFASGNVLPNSGGKVANVFGEPFFAGDALAVIAAHQPASGGETFRGVYRVKAGVLEAVADIATALPGGFGVPDEFSSQVGFDGQLLAFWAAKGPFTQSEGMFVQSAAGTLTKLAQSGDAFPDGGTMDGFISPPFVAGGVVYFYAQDAANVTRLLKSENGTLTVLTRNGDVTPEGDPLQSLGQFGLVAEDGKVFFPALTSKGAGLYVLEAGVLKTIVAPGATVAGLRPTSIVLQDVAADTIVLDVSDAFLNRRLVANLASPTVPVIVATPTNQTVAPGTRLEFKVTALGDAPLAYQWRWSSPTGAVTRSTSDTLVIESAAAGDVGFYNVTVSNPFGTASSGSFLLNVEAAPVISTDPTNTVIEVGDQLILRVNALGGQPLSYAWLKDGSPAVNDTTASGLFSRTSTVAADAGRYTVVVSNAWGHVTSAEAVVTVKPAAPNPVFAGGRFIKILDATTPVPGSATTFHTQVMGEHSARFMGNEILFVGGAADQPQGGVFVWKNGSIVRFLGAGAALPNGLGAAEAFSLIAAPASESLAVRAQKTVNGFLQPVGLYRYDGSGLTVIADTTMAAPDGGGALFPTFFSDASRAAGKTVFAATVGGKPALYLATDAGVSRVLSAQQDLPVVGTATTQLQGLSFDGQTFTVTAATANQQTLVALRANAAGEVTKLLATGDPLPGTADTVRSLGTSDTEGGVSTLLVFNQAFAVNIVEWRDGVLTRVAGPGMNVGTLGTIQTVEASNPKSSAGLSFFNARVATPTGPVLGIVAAGTGGIEPVLFATKLDARRFGAFVVDSDGDRVLVLATFEDGTRALYANLGVVDEEPLRLVFTRPASATLRFTVPEGAKLEATGALGGQWELVPGSGDVDVTVTAGARFFRLRRD